MTQLLLTIPMFDVHAVKSATPPPLPAPPYSIGSKNQPLPFKPDSDQHQLSPDNIHTLSRDKMITKEKIPRSFYQILSTQYLRKCIEISLENLCVDIGA